MTDQSQAPTFSVEATPQPNGLWLIEVCRDDGVSGRRLNAIYGYGFKFETSVHTDRKALRAAERMLSAIRDHVAKYAHREKFEVT